MLFVFTTSEDEGTRTPNHRIDSPGNEVEKPLEEKGFPEPPDPSGTTKGTKSTEPLAPVAGDELLADLVENAEDALLFRLEPGLRFVVQRWPDLTESGQRAILAMVRTLVGLEEEVAAEP